MTFARGWALALLALLAGGLAPSRADDWVQGRHDAALTAQSQDVAPGQPATHWWTLVGQSLVGEPVVLDCRLLAVSGGGEVVSLNARSGGRSWRTLSDRESCTLEPAAAGLAVTEDSAFAGLPGDGGLQEALDLLCAVRQACLSYSISEGAWPPGVDLREELVPAHLQAWPLNRCTGEEVLVTDEPRVGDLRYRREGPEFFLGAWFADGGLIDGTGQCVVPLDAAGTGGLHPTWTLSEALGGRPRALALETGSPSWVLDGELLSAFTLPTLSADGVTWVQAGHSGESFVATGRVTRTTVEGSVVWEKPSLGPSAGHAAVDEVTGRVFHAQAPADASRSINERILVMAAALDSHAVSEGLYPPSGDLTDALVPAYLQALPRNALSGETMLWSPVPSAGDYDYVAEPGQTGYELTIWDEFGEAAAVFDTGGWVRPAEDRPATLSALEATGELAWHVDVGEGSEGTTAPCLIPGDALVVGSSSGVIRALSRADGSELWRESVDGPISQPPAVRVDGISVCTDEGVVWSLGFDGRPEWSARPGGAVEQAVTTTSDGVTLVVDRRARLHALESNGALRWSHATSERPGVRPTPPPIVARD